MIMSRLPGKCRSTALLFILMTGLGTSLAAPSLAATYSGADAMSFEMWRQEMQRYPAARCGARNPNDVKEYERYRTTAEQYQQNRTDQQTRDKQINDRLNRAPTDPKH
jgi:hypothetical protein